jgi:hypothetical protein
MALVEKARAAEEEWVATPYRQCCFARRSAENYEMAQHVQRRRDQAVRQPIVAFFATVQDYGGGKVYGLRKVR